MKRALYPFAAAAAVISGLTIGISSRGADKPAAASLPQPVLNTHHLMELFNKPLYQSLSKELAKEPTGVEGWKKVEADAKRVAEVANLIAIRKEAAEHKDWKQHTEQVQQAAKNLIDAAAKKEYPAAREAYVGLINRCNACHQAAAPDHAPQLQPFGKMK